MKALKLAALFLLAGLLSAGCGTKNEPAVDQAQTAD
jgi:hypothetical protein